MKLSSKSTTRNATTQAVAMTKLASARAQVQQLITRRLGNHASMADQWASNSPVLCLNSRGGDFAEGLRIAKFRRTYGGPGLNDDNRPWVNASLFIEMLRKGPDELFAIDTVGKSGRWGIKLVGVKEIGVLNTQALQRACDNVYSWEGDREGIWEDERLAFEPVPPSDPVFNRLKNMKGVSLFQFQVIRSFNYCAVQAAPSPTPKVESLIIKLYRGLPPDDPSNEYEVPLWAAAFHPSTPLRNLLGK